MDITRVKALIDLLARTNIATLEIAEAGWRVRLARSSPQSVPAVPAGERPTAPSGESVRQPSAAPAPVRNAAHLVSSPMFGVFHRAPAPDAAPFVELGGKVVPGQKLCVIEAMKTFNLLSADVAGTLAEILVESGQEVEAHQPLFRIVP